MRDRGIGKMRHRVGIEVRQGVPDGAGGELASWIVTATVWAAIEPLTGVESLRKDRLAGVLTHRITIRHRNDVTPETRFRSGSRIFNIQVVRDADERHRWLECICEEEYL